MDHQQYARIKQGVASWNQWRQENPTQDIDLRDADLGGMDLTNVNLSRANLIRVNLNGTYLNHANLNDSYLNKANLTRAKLRRANITGANVNAANLSGADLGGADLSWSKFLVTDMSGVNLGWANLNGTNLSETSLGRADLSRANLHRARLWGANLSHAKLVASICESTNFENAVLTGACIEDWITNAKTKLDNVRCDYIYLKWHRQIEEPYDRCPSAPERNFAPDEFSQRFQRVGNTLELFFADGIDWKAFASSFQELQKAYGRKNITIQNLGPRGTGFEVQLALTKTINKAVLERDAYQRYEKKVQMLDTYYGQKLHLSDRDIQRYRQENANIMYILQRLTQRSLTEETKLRRESSSRQTPSFFNDPE